MCPRAAISLPFHWFGVGGGRGRGNVRLCRISFSAIPSFLCVRITDRLVMWPCWTPSAGSSSILARTYPTILG